MYIEYTKDVWLFPPLGEIRVRILVEDNKKLHIDIGIERYSKISYFTPLLKGNIRTLVQGI